jgi:hypothetical protein
MISTSTTTINHTNQKISLKLYDEKEVGITFTGNINSFSISDKFDKKNNHCIDFISDQPKVLISMSMSFYHFYHDCFGEFLAQYEITPNAKFIIDITNVADNKLPNFIKMFFKFLNDNKVDYQPVDLRKIQGFNINNFYYKDSECESRAINDPSPKIYKMSQRYIVDKKVAATKKIFLSRKNYQNRDLSILIKDRLPYTNDNRIDDEKKAQEYFKTLGFETICPEDFKSFEEQMNYMYEARVILSTTSSALTNACFMRPGSTIIELVTPLISFQAVGNGVTSPLSIGQEEVHHFYHLMAFALDHKYLGINNKNRSIDKIIDTIENDKLLKQYILGL